MSPGRRARSTGSSRRPSPTPSSTGGRASQPPLGLTRGRGSTATPPQARTASPPGGAHGPHGRRTCCAVGALAGQGAAGPKGGHAGPPGACSAWWARLLWGAEGQGWTQEHLPCTRGHLQAPGPGRVRSGVLSGTCPRGDAGRPPHTRDPVQHPPRSSCPGGGGGRSETATARGAGGGQTGSQRAPGWAEGAGGVHAAVGQPGPSVAETLMSPPGLRFL